MITCVFTINETRKGGEYVAEGKIGRCSTCNAHVTESSLYPVWRAKLGLANALEVIGMMDAMIGQPSLAPAREGWNERMNELADNLAVEVGELVEFGSAFDSDEPMQAREDEEEDDD
jgi:hypothetical protein